MERKKSGMKERREHLKEMKKPEDHRSKPNPSLRKGTGTMDMGKLVKGPKKSKKGEY